MLPLPRKYSNDIIALSVTNQTQSVAHVVRVDI